jgi:hypothetical protein
MVREGQVFGGRFRVDALLGDGVESSVWAATASSGQRVALKVFEQGALDVSAATAGLVAANRRAAAVGHPAFVGADEIGHTAEGAIFVVTKLVDGLSLRAVLERRGPLPAPWALALAMQLLEALAAAHARALAHGNLKPNSLVLAAPSGPGAALRILNLGLSRPIAVSSASPPRVVGVLDYAAPEALRHPAAPPTPRGDVFACGVVLYEMLTGQLPLAPLTPQDRTIDAKLADRVAYFRSGRAVPLPAMTVDGFPPALVDIVKQATLVDPARRFGDAGQMLHAVRAAARTLPGGVPAIDEETSLDTDVDGPGQGAMDMGRTVVTDPLFVADEPARGVAAAPAYQPPRSKKFLDDQVVPTMILPPDDEPDEEATEETPLDEEAIAGAPGGLHRPAPAFADPFAETALGPDGREAPWTAPMPGAPLEDRGISEAKTTILESARLPEAPRLGPGPPPWAVAPQAASPAWMQQGAPRPAGAPAPGQRPAGNRRLVVMLVAFALAAIGLGALAVVAWAIALR